MNTPDLSQEPINNIRWIGATALKANHYNPNCVANVELTLLERSILETGWLQPLLINPDFIIIDGFHRWSLSLNGERLRTRYGGLVPCCILNLNEADAMMTTIRINRAKGTHIAVKMSAIVKDLIDRLHCDEAEICAKIGATPDEIKLLYAENVFVNRNIQNHTYSRAWRPIETP